MVNIDSCLNIASSNKMYTNKGNGTPHKCTRLNIIFIKGTCMELDEPPSSTLSLTIQITDFTFTHDKNIDRPSKATHQKM
jgi:hypothetical protein